MDMPLSARIATAHLPTAPEREGAVVNTLGTVFVGLRFAEVWRVNNATGWHVTFGTYHESYDSCYVGDRTQAIDFAVRYLSVPTVAS